MTSSPGREIPEEILCNHQIKRTRMELPNGKVMKGPFGAFSYTRNTTVEIDNWPDINGVGRTDRVDELIVAMIDRRSLFADEAPPGPEVPGSP